MERIRAFIAIELTDEVKAAISRLQSRLKSASPVPARWVAPQGIHLTLKFLGDIPLNSASAVTGAMQQAAREIPPFRLQVRGLGVFPNPRRVRIAWAGIEGDLTHLVRLQERLDDGLVPLGFARETRAFTPHLTLARVRDSASPAEQESFGKIVTAATFSEAPGFSVGSVHLIKSQLGREGAVYDRISSVALEKPLPTSTA